MPLLRQTRDGSYTLYSAQYKQTYHSVHGARTEAEHVFLAGTGVAERLQAGEATRILEVGFGTGMNFFFTADLARAHNTALSYWAFEQNLLDAATIHQVDISGMLSDPGLVDTFFEWRNSLPPHPPDGLLRWVVDDSLSLTLILGNAVYAPLPETAVHAVYMDAFSPEQNEELWTISFLEKLCRALTPGGKLATYSAKSMVRKNMLTAGFETTKAPGPLGKREMLIGTRPTSA